MMNFHHLWLNPVLMDSLNPLRIWLTIESLRVGICPLELKIAKVVPVFKSADPSLFTNYRPISVLPFLSNQVLEKIVYNCLFHFICNNNPGNIDLPLRIRSSDNFRKFSRSAESRQNS